jgi:hypothetical protein
MKTDLLDIYSDYLISQNHYATATGIAAMFDGEISHEQFSRHLRTGEFGSKELWAYVKSDVRRQIQFNHLFSSMVAYCKLELLKVKTAMNHFAIKRKLLLKAHQIMLNELQLLKAAS